MPVVTISAQQGAGREVAALVAELLNVDLVDRQIIVQAANRLGASEEEVEAHDERTDSLAERVGHLLRVFLERSAMAGGAADAGMALDGLDALTARTYAEEAAAAGTSEGEVTDRRFLEVTTNLIRELASQGNVVIRGRGGQFILKNQPGVLRVMLTAPRELRLRRIMESEKLDEDAAERRLQESQHNRSSYHRKFFDADPDDPANYDLVVNTERLSYEDAARLIAEAARKLEIGR